jgi:hypothetical protein
MYSRLLLISLFLVAANSYANDLDDGIGIDNRIDDGLDLGKNTKFIIRKGLSKAKASNKAGGKDGSQSGSCGTGNIIIGAGSKIKEVYNISTNKGTTTVCGKK